MTDTIKPKDKKRYVVKDAPAEEGDGSPLFRDLCIARLKPIAEKVGGNVDTAEQMELLAPPTAYVPTGIHCLDNILSLGLGLPCGRFVEIFAPEAVGKTALCEFLLGRFKAVGGTLHYIDSENARNDAHLACYGINPSELIAPDLPDLESVWDYITGVAAALTESNEARAKLGKGPEKPNIVVLDSLAATPARAELEEASHDDSHVAEQARANSKGTRKTIRRFSATDAVLICINQNRDKIGAMGYGPKTDTPGGRALKYAYSIRLKLAKIETLWKGPKEDQMAIGHIVEVTAVKNKFAPQGQKCKLVLSYLRGIDVAWTNFLWFQGHRFITPAGSVGYKFKGCPDTFKRSAFAQFCIDHKDLVDKAVEECLTEDRKILVAEADTAPKTEPDAT